MGDLIITNPEILGGKPVIKGTRIPVKFIFDLFGQGFSIDEILEEYPTLTQKILLELVEIGIDAQKSLCGAHLEQYLDKETPLT